MNDEVSFACVNEHLIIKAQAAWRGYSTRKSLQSARDNFTSTFHELEGCAPNTIPNQFIQTPSYIKTKQKSALVDALPRENPSDSHSTGNQQSETNSVDNTQSHRNSLLDIHAVENSHSDTQSVNPAANDPSNCKTHTDIVDKPNVIKINSENISHHTESGSEHSVKSSSGLDSDVNSVNAPGTNCGFAQATYLHQKHDSHQNHTKDNDKTPAPESSKVPVFSQDGSLSDSHESLSKPQGPFSGSQRTLSGSVSSLKSDSNCVNGTNVVDSAVANDLMPGVSVGPPQRSQLGHRSQRSQLGQSTATSVWDSVDLRNQYSQNVTGFEQSKLEDEKSNVVLELLWVQQAIESRKQYLRLKSNIKG